MSNAVDKSRRDEAYAAHRREQLQRWALVPFAQKLQWLEEAHHMVLALHKSREAQPGAQQESQDEAEPQVLARN